MPLAHTPHRPRPEVEFRNLTTITTEAALQGLETSLASTEEDEGSFEAPGSALIKFTQIPGIAAALRDDWVTGAGKDGLGSGCFVEVEGRLEVHMHPCYLGPKLALGLRGAAGSLLLNYNERLRCVPIGFTSLQPVGGYGAVVGESPYVHFLIGFRAVGFRPKKGQTIVGRIAQHQTKVGLNILVLNCFNLFVRSAVLPESFRYDEESGVWADEAAGREVGPALGRVFAAITHDLKDNNFGLASLWGTLLWESQGKAGKKAVGACKPEAVQLEDASAKKKRRSKAAAEAAQEEAITGAGHRTSRGERSLPSAPAEPESGKKKVAAMRTKDAKKETNSDSDGQHAGGASGRGGRGGRGADAGRGRGGRGRGRGVPEETAAGPVAEKPLKQSAKKAKVSEGGATAAPEAAVKVETREDGAVPAPTAKKAKVSMPSL